MQNLTLFNSKMKAIEGIKIDTVQEIKIERKI